MRFLFCSLLIFFHAPKAVSQSIVLGKKLNLDNKITEISGFIKVGNNFFAINDGGNPSEIHQIDTQSGSVIRSIKIKSVNIDWEEMTYDDTSIFIGDFGNNKGDRKNLRILKFNKSELNKDTIIPEIIDFYYSDQTNFTSRDFHNYDCEAMIPAINGLYLFTKNRLDLKCNLYWVPKTPGSYSLSKIDSIGLNYMITGATKSPKGELWLCGYDYSLNYDVSVVKDWKLQNRIKGNIKTKMFDDGPAQFESIISLNDSLFVMASESLSGKPAFMAIGKLQYQLLTLSKIDLELLQAFPNEFLSNLKVNYTSQVTAICILNSLGKVVYSSKTQKEISSMDFDLTSLSSGQYTLIFKSKSKVLKSIKIEKI